ncbi:MAG: phage tail tape measure protein [Pyrinomonadaceae bacterium]
MGSSTAFELAILLSLRDAASGGLDRFEGKLRATGKEGRKFLHDIEDMRKSVGRDFAIAGTGLVTLAMLKKGVDAAGDYESSLLDLRGAYQEIASAGGRSATQQASDINNLMALSTSLGNNLQGSTADYVGILTSLKKAGVDVETVLGGAGEAAANLANVSGALKMGQANEQAKELGQFGKLFDLSGKDFGKSVDLFSALKDRFDIESSDLIQSAKYFNNTARGLKLTGFEGAAETSKFFALLKRQGAMEGSEAGTSATSFFQQFIAKAKDRKKVKKATGLDIQLFDEKGEFLGMENAFAQMEKFRKFSSEKRLEILNKLYGEQGGKVAGVMVDAGAEGWRNVTAEAAKAVPVNEKINQQMATYNAKMEAVLGTLENIKAITFAPMLDTVKPLLDSANSFLGSAQGFAQGHQDLVKYGLGLITLGTTVYTLKGAVGGLTTSWQLWRIASDIGKSGNLVEYFARLKDGAGGVGVGLDAATGKVGKMRGILSELTSSPFKLTLTVAAIGFTIEQLLELYHWIKESEKAERVLAQAQRERAAGTTAAVASFTHHGVEKDGVPADFWNKSAKGILATLNPPEVTANFAGVIPYTAAGRDLEFGLMPERMGLYGSVMKDVFGPGNRFRAWQKSPEYGETQKAYDRREGPLYQRTQELEKGGMHFTAALARVADELKGANTFKAQAGDVLKFPELMASFRKAVESLNPTDEARDRLNNMLKLAAPDTFAKSTGLLAQMTEQSGRDLGSLHDKTLPLIQSFGDIRQPLSFFPGALGSATTAAESFADRVNGIQIQIPAPAQGGTTSGPRFLPNLDGTLSIPSRASGGIVRRTGFAEVHEREAIVPAHVTDKWRDADAPATLGSGRSADFTAPATLTRRQSINFEETFTAQRQQRRGGDRHIHLHKGAISIPPGSRAAEDPRAFFDEFMDRLAHEEAISDERA